MFGCFACAMSAVIAVNRGARMSRVKECMLGSIVIDWKLTDDDLLVRTPFIALNKISLCYKIETIAPRAN